MRRIVRLLFSLMIVFTLAACSSSATSEKQEVT